MQSYVVYCRLLPVAYCHACRNLSCMCLCAHVHVVTTSFTRTADAFMTTAMRALVLSKQAEIQELAAARKIELDWNVINSTTNSREFETALMLPIYHQYANLDDYLTDNSSCHSLKVCRSVRLSTQIYTRRMIFVFERFFWNKGAALLRAWLALIALQDINVPTLFMTALDDPLIHKSIPKVVLDAATTNANICFLSTARGGHLGWLTGWKGRSWSMAVILQWMDVVLQQWAEKQLQQPEHAPDAMP